MIVLGPRHHLRHFFAQIRYGFLPRAVVHHMADLRPHRRPAGFGGQPRAHAGRGADRLQFIEHGFELLGIVQPDKPVHMPDHGIQYSMQIKSAYASRLDATRWEYTICHC